MEHEFKKREVKAPKVYLTDSGILHTLLGIGDQEALLAHPKCGASWEGFMLGEVIRHWKASPKESFFWKEHTGPELDLLLIKNRKRLGFEFKLTNSPTVTSSMKSALEALQLQHLYVICHGTGNPWPLAKKISVVPVMGMIKKSSKI